MSREKIRGWKCPVCGRTFEASSEVWTYQRQVGRKRVMFCGWNCYRTLPEKRVYIKREK